MESCPDFRHAVKELEELLAKKESEQNIVDAMSHELHRLEEDFTLRIGALRGLIEEIKSK